QSRARELWDRATGTGEKGMRMPVLTTDPFIRIRVSDGTTAVGLHDVLARSHDGTLIDFPGMRSDQRAPVVTVLAILSHLLGRYSASPLLTSQDWLDALQSQLGDALVLAGGSEKKPQFLQPVLVGLGDIKPFNITETDHLMAANRHVLKVADVATPEMALYAL